MSGKFPPEKPRRIAVLGGGPAGLAAAYRLLQSAAPLRVDLYESTTKLGGVVTTEYGGGFRYELGPASMNLKHAGVGDLVHEKLALGSRIVSRSPKANQFYIEKDGQLLAVPTSPLQFVQSKLISWKAKLAILKEPFVSKLDDDKKAAQETVEQFFERRFNREVVDYLVDPALAGIYSAQPAQLSMKHAFASVWKLERKEGSVIGGKLKSGKPPADPRFRSFSAKELRASISFDDGMQVVTDTLAERIRQGNGRGGRVYTLGQVRMIDRDVDGTWFVNGRGKYDAVISTIPTHALRNVSCNVSSVERKLRRLARNIKYAPVSIVVLGFDRSQVTHPLDGYGALIPSKEGRKVLGVNFTSSNFPSSLKDPNKVFLTVYVGGSRSPDLPFKPAREVVKVATDEMRSLLGVSGKPFYSRVKTWTTGIPLYAENYDEAKKTMSRLERKNPGLILGGNYRGGVGIPDALLSGINAANKAIDFVRQIP